nr:serine/arginine repetitive matrix protein 1-like [Aegilops tauschii subsp. strangulata]
MVLHAMSDLSPSEEVGVTFARRKLRPALAKETQKAGGQLGAPALYLAAARPTASLSPSFSCTCKLSSLSVSRAEEELVRAHARPLWSPPVRRAPPSPGSRPDTASRPPKLAWPRLRASRPAVRASRPRRSRVLAALLSWSYSRAPSVAAAVSVTPQQLERRFASAPYPPQLVVAEQEEEEVNPVVSVTTRAGADPVGEDGPARRALEAVGVAGAAADDAELTDPAGGGPEEERREAAAHLAAAVRSVDAELARVPRLTLLLLALPRSGRSSSPASDGAGARAASSPPLVAAASSPTPSAHRRAPPSPPCSQCAGPGVPEPPQGELEERWRPAASSLRATRPPRRGAEVLGVDTAGNICSPSPKLAPA